VVRVVSATHEDRGVRGNLSASIAGRALVVSHAAVLTVNQLPYAALSQQGWDVDLVVPSTWRHAYSAGEFAATPQPALATRLHPIPVAFRGQPQRHMYLALPLRLLRRAQPNFVLLEQEPFSVSALQWGIAAHRAGIPFAVQSAENLDRQLPAPVRAWRGWVLRNAAFVGARSPAAAALARRWGAPGEVVVIPHHVPAWPEVVPEASDRFRVGFAGRLVAEKGLDTLVDAVCQLDGAVDLVVAGDGPMRAWLESQDLGSARLRLLTDIPHDAMDQAYAQMDVLVLPSRSTPAWTEQFGRVLVEALWCGVPVVGSDSGEIPWLVETTRGGRVFPEGDAHALAQVLRELRGDPAARYRFAVEGRQQVQERFGAEAAATALAQTMNAVLEARRPAPRRGVRDPRPRVALVAHGIHDLGGMERACAELIRHLHRDVRFVAVTAELAPELLPLLERWIRVRVPRRPMPLKFLSFFVAGGFAVRRAGADVIHTVGAIVPNRVDVAAVHFCHAGARSARVPSPTGSGRARRANSALARALAQAAERWCYRPSRLRRLAAVSSGTGAEVARHYPDVPVVVIHNGVDLTRFAPDESERRAVREREGAPDDLVALFVGGDWDRKGLGIAIEALAKVRAHGVAPVLWVVGDGDIPRFQALAGECGMETAVEFFGRRTDTESFYRAADVFVLPSGYETFSLACFEAAACGLPLVVTSIPTATVLVGDGEAGVVVDRNAGAVADALLMLSDDAIRRRMGAAARDRVKHYTWEVAATATAALYRQLVPVSDGVPA
jgi:glycosyltransferase involved in cell wall biosynthesis